MKPSIYIETSIISYLASWKSRDVIVSARQAITHGWWNHHRDRFELRISALVEEEIQRGDQEAVKRRLSWVAEIPSLAITDQASELANRLLVKKVIPEGSEDDALHIGIAVAQGTDYLLTWNFRHINNAETKSAITSIIESSGYVCPQICSPEELGGVTND